MYNYLEYLLLSRKEKAHMWKCEPCELFYVCEDKVCHKCEELSPYLMDNCPGCFSDHMVGSAYDY